MPADSKTEGMTSNVVQEPSISYKPVYVMAAVIFVFILIGIIVPLVIVFLANNPISDNIKQEDDELMLSTGNILLES